MCGKLQRPRGSLGAGRYGRRHAQHSCESPAGKFSDALLIAEQASRWGRSWDSEGAGSLTKEANAKGLVGAKHEALNNSTHLTHLWV